jgi:hypothetical protein
MKTKKTKQYTEKSIDELHSESKLWISEIAFIRDEIRFLSHLLSAKYIDYLYEGLSSKIENFTKKMTEEINSGKILVDSIETHELLLPELIEKDNLINNIQYQESHTKLKNAVEIYLVQYKILKKQIFEVVEKVMQKKNQKKLV